MKAVLLSTQPKWCELDASGRKKAEVRKTRPKLETPFKVYIYCTKPETKNPHEILEIHGADGKIRKANGKVIGEFVCDRIHYWQYNWNTEIMHICDMSELTCVSVDDLLKYADNGTSRLFGWHISDLVIYDKPKGISEFYKSCATQDCLACQFFENDGCETKPLRRLKRPPQSWCYVEEV